LCNINKLNGVLIHFTHRFFRRAIKSIKSVTGTEPEIAYFSSIGDFNYIGSRLNIPTFVFGPDGERYHSYDEYVRINTVVDTTNVIYDYMVRILT